MLRWTITFLLIALLAGALGFGVIEGLAALIARVLFFLFIVAFIVSLVMNARRPPVA